MRSRPQKAPGASQLARKAQRAPERSVLGYASTRAQLQHSAAATPQSPPLGLLPEWDPATEDPRRASRTRARSVPGCVNGYGESGPIQARVQTIAVFVHACQRLEHMAGASTQCPGEGHWETRPAGVVSTMVRAAPLQPSSGSQTSSEVGAVYA